MGSTVEVGSGEGSMVVSGGGSVGGSGVGSGAVVGGGGEVGSGVAGVEQAVSTKRVERSTYNIALCFINFLPLRRPERISCKNCYFACTSIRLIYK